MISTNYIGLQEVWSGGQTGADEAGLEAARLNGIKTNGWAPKDFRTQRGNNPNLKTIYGLKESEAVNYAKRTELNVRCTEGTIRLASNINSSGELCTLKAIKKHKRPYFDVHLPEYDIKEIIDWIVSNNISRLNIAGNSDKGKDTYHYDVVLKILTEVFAEIKNEYV